LVEPVLVKIKFGCANVEDAKLGFVGVETTQLYWSGTAVPLQRGAMLLLVVLTESGEQPVEGVAVNAHVGGSITQMVLVSILGLEQEFFSVSVTLYEPALVKVNGRLVDPEVQRR
jgi:hypothetical protein